MKTNIKFLDAGVLTMGSVAASLLLAAAGCGGEPMNGGDSAGTGSPETVAPAPFDPPSPSAADEQEMNLRATVVLPDRAVVKFYEPENGLILVTEAGRNGNPPVITADMKKLSAVALYEGLTNEKAPAPLVEAAGRAAQLQRVARPIREAAALDVTPAFLRAPATVATGSAGQLEKVTSALTFSSSYDQWFYDNFCENGHNVGDWTWGITWMYSSGSGNFTRYDNNLVSSTVSVYGGDSVHAKFQIQPWYSWSTPKDLFIQNGYYYGYFRVDLSIDFDFRVYVDQASGDSYHWCSYGDN